MDNMKFCQSCTMPLDKPDVRGTEKDGSPSTDYCKYCYQNGAYTSPELTIEQMKGIVKTEMDKQHIAPGIIAQSLSMLPYLKRWKH